MNGPDGHPTVAEAEAVLNLESPHVVNLEDTPGFLDQKKRVCEAAGKECRLCENRFCKNGEKYSDPDKREVN